MKKLFTLFAFTIIATATFAQREVDLLIDEILEPTELRSEVDGTTGKTTWPVSVVIKNQGVDNLLIGDTLLWAVQLVNINNGSPLETAPSNAASGGRYVSKLTKDLAPGDTTLFNVTLTIPRSISKSINVRFIFVMTPYKSDLTDTGTTNNLLNSEIVWYNTNGFNVGIDQVKFDHNLHVYPSPVSNELNVALLAASINKSTIEIYDTKGQLVMTHQDLNAFEDKHVKLNTSTLENGIYILKVSNGNDMSSTKFVVAH